MFYLHGPEPNHQGERKVQHKQQVKENVQKVWPRIVAAGGKDVPRSGIHARVFVSRFLLRTEEVGHVHIAIADNSVMPQ